LARKEKDRERLDKLRREKERCRVEKRRKEEEEVGRRKEEEVQKQRQLKDQLDAIINGRENVGEAEGKMGFIGKIEITNQDKELLQKELWKLEDRKYSPQSKNSKYVVKEENGLLLVKQNSRKNLNDPEPTPLWFDMNQNKPLTPLVKKPNIPMAVQKSSPPKKGQNQKKLLSDRPSRRNLFPENKMVANPAFDPRGCALKENIEIIPAAKNANNANIANNANAKKLPGQFDSKNINRGIEVMNKDIEMLDSRLDELKEKNLDARQKMKADIRLKRDAMRQQKIDAKADTKFHLILQQPLTGLSLHNATNPKDSPEPPKAPTPLLNRQQSDDILVKNLVTQKDANNLNDKLQFLEALEQKIIISEQHENFSNENEKIL
jgi:hypothetical protein